MDVAYLDHAASSPMRPEAIDAMVPWLRENPSNPSGAHKGARAARRVIDEARDTVAELVGCRPGEVVFCSGGTEADNLAVRGSGASGAALLCSAIEHHAVLEPVLAAGGRTVAVGAGGVVDLDDLKRMLDPDVRFVSVMAVNNETGARQPLDRVGELVAELAPHAVVHTDAVQAFCWADLRPLTARAQLVSLSAHKFGGPKGVGVLVVRDGAPLTPMLLGGGQERERRSGTQNVAGIAAMAAAMRITAEQRPVELQRLVALRATLVEGLARIDGLRFTVDDGVAVPGIVHVCIDGVESESLLYLLEQQGVYAAAASSCASGAMQPSHVLSAMGVPPSGSLRLSMGWTTTATDVRRAVAAVTSAVEQLRSRA